MTNTITNNHTMSIATRRRADQGHPVFTSTKCPAGPGLEHSCELPFGFVWTPFAVVANDGVMTKIDCHGSSLPPVLCLTCLAYLNPFCQVHDDGVTWTCALCGQDNVAPPGSLHEGAMFKARASPLVEYHQQWTSTTGSVTAAVPKGSTTATKDPPQEKNKQQRQEEEDDDDSCTYILVVDANLSSEDAQGIVKAMEKVLENTPTDMPKLRLGLVVFHHAVAMYQLGVHGVASADVYYNMTSSSDAGETEEALLAKRTAMEKRAYLKEISKPQDLQSLKQCMEAVFGVDVDLDNDENEDVNDPSSPRRQQEAKSRKEMLRQKKEARMRNQEIAELSGNRNAFDKKNDSKSKQSAAESPWVQRRQEARTHRHPQRCTGEAIQCAMDMTTLGDSPSRTSRILLFTNGCPNLGDGSVVAERDSDIIISGTSSPKKSGPGSSTAAKRLHDVVDTDMLNKAVEYFDLTATFALETGIAMDVFCAGVSELGLPAYQALVEPSGGYVLSHLTFSSIHLLHNLQYLLHHTYLSLKRTDSVMTQDFATDGKKGTVKDEVLGATECIIDIRSDSFVVPTHLVGNGEIVASMDEGSKVIEHERSSFAVGASLAAGKGLKTNNLPNNEALELSLTRMKLPRVDPLSTLSVMVQVNDTMEETDDYAFFQVTARHIDRSGKTFITRVSTQRLQVASDVSAFVESVDDEAVSVMLAKAAVWRSLHGREETEDARDKTTAGDNDMLEKLAYEAQLDLDATVQRISGAFRLLGLERGTRSRDISGARDEKKESQSSLDFAFPPQLTDSLHRLYHLRRGALISPGPMRSMDDRAEMRQLYSRFPLEDCLGMMAPNLWSTGSLEGLADPMPVMQPFPAETMALWDTSIIAADQHDMLFIWCGKYCAGPQYDEIREKFKEFLLKQSKNRFPLPELHMLYDGDSMSRRFTSRLAPSHADSHDQQLAHFPQLSTLSESALERLRARFKFYDASSDASFRTWFWSVSSATHASRKDGQSLCE